MLETLGVSLFDIAVIGVVLLGALIGFIIGFIRGGLFVLSWAGAVVATVFGFSTATSLARAYIDPAWLADVIAGAILFLVALVLLHLISYAVSSWVRDSRLNALDRSLGLVAGMFAAALLVSATYLAVLGDTLPPEQPSWIQQAKTRPLVEVGALTVLDLVPSRYRLNTGDALVRARAQLQQREPEVLERLTKPPAIIVPLEREAYGEAARRELDQLVESTR